MALIAVSILLTPVVLPAQATQAPLSQPDQMAIIREVTAALRELKCTCNPAELECSKVEITKRNCVCEAGDEIALLESLADPQRVKDREAAQEVAFAASRCLRKAGWDQAKLERFRQLAENASCLDSRLSRAGWQLEQVLKQDLPNTLPAGYDATIDSAVDTVRETVRTFRMMKERPTEIAVIDRAQALCISGGSLQEGREKLAQFLPKFTDLVVSISARFPQLAPHLGSVLDAISVDSIEIFGGHDYQAQLKEDRTLLVGWDNSNLAGTSHFYQLRQELAKKEELSSLIPRADAPSYEAVRPQFDEQTQLVRKLLADGATHLVSKANAWRAYEIYAEQLFGFADSLMLAPERRWARFVLMEAAADAMRQGLETSLGSDLTEPLDKKRQDLGTRVLNYARELAESGYDSEVVRLEEHFADSPAFTEEARCTIHAHLAQANCRLGRHSEAMAHLRLWRMCGGVGALSSDCQLE